MTLRQDFPLTPENQKYYQVLLSRTQEAFPQSFPTIDSVVQYVNNFNSPKTAELFLNIGNYYRSTQDTPPFNTLISFLSVMEKLSFVESSGVESWVDFYDWVSQKDVDAEYKQVLRKGLFRDFTALMDSLKGKWSKQFGGITKVTNFLRVHMRPEEKLALIQSIRYLQVAPELPQQADSKTVTAALPACFESRQPQKCYTASSQKYCSDSSDCCIIGDEAKLDKYFKDTIKTLYDWRIRFVFDAQLPPIKENVLYGVQYRGKYANAEISISKFKPVFEVLIKRFFNNYQVLPSKKLKKH